jgi:hypothetical protein
MKPFLPNYTMISKVITTVLFLLALGGVAFGQTVETFSTPGAGNWTVPCGVTSITVQIWGGGGAGGGDGTNDFPAGSGGGSGAYVSHTFAVTAGNVYNFTIGSGGIGVFEGNGGNGTATSFTGPGSALNASGGFGGSANSNTAGLGGTTATGGNINTIGVNGGSQTGISSGFGAGAPNGGGNVTGCSSNGCTGALGSAFGGGGAGGGPRGGGSSSTGGNGASGGVIITYTSTLTQPNAGANINSCGALSFSANTPDAGWTGTWVLTAGSGTADSPNDPNSSISGIAAGSCATFEWRFSQAGCLTMVDPITVCIPSSCNDDICNAQPLTVNTTCSYTSYSNNGATVSTTQPESGCGSFSQAASEDVWFSAVVPANGILTIDAIDAPGGSSFYPGIAIYSGDCVSIQHEGCDYTTSTLTSSSVTYTGTPGETIYIRVWDYLDAFGVFQICASTHNNTISDIVTGNTTLACGTPQTFSDPGGSGNYSINTSAFYTICPDVSGEYVSVNFSNFNLGSGDYLLVMNGSGNQNYIIYEGSGSTNPGTITSSASDGCLSFSFVSNSSLVGSGWDAVVSCSSAAGVNDTTTYCSQQDCMGGCATWICQDGQLPAVNAVSIGANELSAQTNGCWSTSYEVSSNWYYFQAETTGTIEFGFDGPPGQDYDFAVYGPTTDYTIPCPTKGYTPIRCSFSGASNPIGIGNGATDHYEEGGGDGWVEALNVQAGETYALIVNIFQNGGPQPVIDLTVGGTGTLDCNPIVLDVNLMRFQGYVEEGRNLLSWVTANEVDNDFFTLERSVDGVIWIPVGKVTGAGNSHNALFYSMPDYNYYTPITYYRLKQTDFDGSVTISKTISISRSDFEGEFVSSVFPNPTDGNMTFVYNGDVFNMPLNVELSDQYGKVVMMSSFVPNSSGYAYILQTEDLAPGVYFVSFTQGHKTEIQKLSILK